MDGSSARLVLVLGVACGFTSLGCDRGQPSAVAINQGPGTRDTHVVTSAGRLAACMECHKSAKPDRLFGAKSVAED